MIREYLLISATTLALLVEKKPEWANIPRHSTIYTYANGDTVRVYDSRFIDSLELRGWNDINVEYPINVNDSNNVHIVHLHDSEIVH